MIHVTRPELENYDNLLKSIESNKMYIQPNQLNELRLIVLKLFNRKMCTSCTNVILNEFHNLREFVYNELNKIEDLKLSTEKVDTKKRKLKNEK